MGNSFPSWLTRQMVRGISGFNLDSYLMALEGWRRGLTLTWHLDPSLETDLKIIGFYPLGKSFSLQSKDKIHYFYRSRGDKVTNDAVDIGTNKQFTRERLINANVPTPEGKTFNLKKTSSQEILNYAESLGFPVVTKPTFGSLGKGVTTNITDTNELAESINHIKELGYEDIIVEEYFKGIDYRIYVVDEKVVGATKRLPANVIGDGKHSIEQLIYLKNQTRNRNPYLRTKLIKIDEHLQQLLERGNRSLSTIPKVNELVYLRDVANISAGGDPINVLDELSPTIQQAAVNALKSIPGLTHGGIDILVKENGYRVIEINATADISMHMFPILGEPTNVPAEIMNYYFPNTKVQSGLNSKFYFDYQRIRKLFLNKQIQSYQVVDAPIQFYSTRYIVSGKVQGVSYRKWIMKQAVHKGLHGYTRNLKNGKVVVVVGGEEKTVKEFKRICQNGSPKSKVEKVKVLDWKKQIKAGFEIRKTR